MHAYNEILFSFSAFQFCSSRTVEEGGSTFYFSFTYINVYIYIHTYVSLYVHTIYRSIFFLHLSWLWRVCFYAELILLFFPLILLCVVFHFILLFVVLSRWLRVCRFVAPGSSISASVTVYFPFNSCTYLESCG